jgi:autotransporter-associated beta strand protein
MKKIKVFLLALVLSMSSLLMFAAPRALAATRTWDGGGSDNNMTTAANWSSDTAPVAGDDLVFPANITKRTITNDFTAATSFNSIAFSGTMTQDSNYSISGNSMTLVAGIANSMTGSFSGGVVMANNLILNGTQTFNGGASYLSLTGTLNLGSNTLTISGTGSISISGVISGSGGITKTGTSDLILDGDNTYTGATTLNAGVIAGGHVHSLGTAAGGTTVASGAGLYLYKATGDVTYDEPLTLNGNGPNEFTGALTVGVSYGTGGGTVTPFPTSTFSGAITLGSNISVSTGDRNGKITGPITGSHTISLLNSASGTFELASSSNGSSTPNGVLTQAVKETKYEADSPSTTITVVQNETAIVTGTYGAVTVNVGGTLKGTGTMGNVYVAGTIAPGLSPGCLSSGDLTLQPSAVYQFELGGTTACTQYDQIKVTGGLAGTLNLVRYNNFKPVAGQKYVIISNDSNDPVSSTFAGLAQGATFTVDGYTFSISYTGGDGNDVELTVTAAAPDAGFALIKNNPMITLAVTLGGTAGLLLITRRGFKPHRARR